MKTKNELKKLDEKSLKEECFKLKKEFFNLKLNLNGGELKDCSQFKKIKKNIARSLTFIRQNRNMG